MAVIFLASFTYAQEHGIRFENGLNWEQIKAKAKDEKKLIFIDCYATWCGPCKYMSENIFPMDSVGNFFNPNFISLKLQMDRTANDSEDVKKWYDLAKEIAKKYGVESYPTYLFFNSDGTLIHRIVGSSNSAAVFIDKASDAFNPDKQYINLIKSYKFHLGDSTFLRNAIVVALNEGDKRNAEQIGNSYIKCIINPFAKDNLELFESMIFSSESAAFKLFYNNSRKIGDIMGFPDYAGGIIRVVIEKEEIKPVLNKKRSRPDWNKLTAVLKLKYPQYADRVISESKVKYYLDTKQYSYYDHAVLSFLKHYSKDLGTFDINSTAWDIFLNSSDKAVLMEAATQLKIRIDQHTSKGGNYVNYVDTYANLLYKMGVKGNALYWEKIALSTAKDQDMQDKVQTFANTIDKIEKGEKTWD